VRAESVVTFNVAADFPTSLNQVNVVFEIDLFVLQAAPESFHDYIVQRPPLAVHADVYTGGQKGLEESRPSELRSLIGVEDLRIPVALASLFQCMDDELLIDGNGQLPGKYFPRIPIQNRHQVYKAVG